METYIVRCIRKIELRGDVMPTASQSSNDLFVKYQVVFFDLANEICVSEVGTVYGVKKICACTSSTRGIVQ